MATAIQTMQSSALTSQPQSSATTAPVREHVCLFTHDLRRKQKRWQDGRLKYHTFNRRVMVYDERGSFIGDTHWREDYDLADGDDLALERGGIIIQVGECVGSRDQDLSELIDKRAQERAQRQAAVAAAAAARQPLTAPVATLHAVKPPSLPQKHLHSVIGTPSGHHGRAVIPRESPYDERRQRQAAPQSDDTRPAKRQRRDISPPSKSGYAQNLFGATLTLSGRSSSQGSARPRPPKISLTREELTSPPSSDTNNQNDHPSPTMDAAQTTNPLQNAQGYFSREGSLQGNHAQMSRKTFPRLHSLTKPGLPPYLNLNLLDQPGKSPLPRHQHSKSGVEVEMEIIDRNSVLNSRSADQNSWKSTETDMSLEQASPKTDRSSKLLVIGVSKKTRDKRRSGTGNVQTQGETSKGSNIIDLSEDGTKAPHKRPVPEEARTELRIKPRKKRGLLMVSERDSMRGSSSKIETAETAPSTDSLTSSSKAQAVDVSSERRAEKGTSTDAENIWADSRKGIRRNAPQRKQVNRNVDDNNDDNSCLQLSDIDNSRHPGEDDGMDGMPYLDRPSAKTWREVKSKPTVEHGDNPVAETYVIETMRRLRPKRQPLSEDAVVSNGVGEVPGRSNSARRGDNAPVDEMPAPRLAKLGRKSIRSREVIGFVFDEEPDPVVSIRPALDCQPDQPIGKRPYQTYIEAADGIVAPKAQPEAEPEPRSNGLLAAKGPAALQRQNSGTMRSLDNEANLINHNEEVPSTITTATTTTTKQSIPRITNPATRGKRAAKPSDAAGQVPICPLPPEPAGHPLVYENPRRMNMQGELDKEIRGPLPGFSRANGGPWSREAHDLFDFKRPS
ncbi:hypothetical protein HD806DRAFT_486163 [Xylariaceae sp. AK1471]|nr:hypothetical protein HD806DRAFT_486163 [Xylariaceae sp. AK1471]